VLSNPPTLWNPLQLFLYLGEWAGVPIVLIAIVATVLGTYRSLKDWIAFAATTKRVAGRTQAWAMRLTTSQQRGLMRFSLLSALMVALSYTVAAIIAAAIQAIKVNPEVAFSLHDALKGVEVQPWPPVAVCLVVGEIAGLGILGVARIADLRGVQNLVTALGSVIWFAAWVVGLLLARDTVILCLGLLLGAVGPRTSSGAPPVPLLVTVAITAGLSLLLAQLPRRIRSASADAFDSSRQLSARY